MDLHTVTSLAKTKDGYWYLASPYSKYPGGMEMAFAHISKIAAELLQAGVPIFCPIAHSHPLAEFGNMEKADHDVWLPLDEHMMRNAKGVIVAKMPSWSDSYGVTWEIDYFTKLGRPVMFLDMPDWVAEDVELHTPPEFVSNDEAAAVCGNLASDAYDSIVGVNAILRGAQSAPMDSKTRKAHPLATGVLDYFPDALMAVAAVSKAGNDQHNPGQPLHWERGTSMDHADCLLRHMKDRGTVDTDKQLHSAKVAWRALAMLQEEVETSLPRGAYTSSSASSPLRTGVHTAASPTAKEAQKKMNAQKSSMLDGVTTAESAKSRYRLD